MSNKIPGFSRSNLVNHSDYTTEIAQNNSMEVQQIQAGCQQWIEEVRRSDPHEYQQRKIATALIDENMRTKELELDLGGLELSKEPPLFPSQITSLSLEDNCLRQLEAPLPPYLEQLNLAENKLTKLPVLPGTLTQLILTGNPLQQISLPSLPTLQALYMDRCAITDLRGIQLPPQLEFLSLCHNKITSMPDNLPKLLTSIDASYNQLNTLPASYEQCLFNRLSLAGNPLTDLPDQLRMALNTRGLNIPHPLLADASTNPHITPLSAAHLQQKGLFFWLPEAEKNLIWQEILQEKFANDFCLFLYRLNTTNSNNSSILQQQLFRQQIAQWLNRLTQQESQQLREATFALANEVTQACIEEAGLFYAHFKMLLFVDEIQKGHYDTHPAKLYQLGRGMFNLHLLEQIASRKVEQIRTTRLAGTEESTAEEELKIHLNYQVMLAEKLKLPIDLSTLPCFDVMHLTQQDLADAEAEIKYRTPAEFWPYLLLKWQPWQIVLHHRFPDEFRQGENQIRALSDDQQQIEQRIDNYLRQQRLPINNKKARINASVAILHSMQMAFLEPLSYRFYPQLKKVHPPI